MIRPSLLFVVNVDWFFCSHRLPVAIGALRDGYEVHIATTFTRPELRDLLARSGFHLHDLSIDRSGKSPLSFYTNFFLIYKVFCSLNPDIVHLVTIQPILIGGFAARIAGVRRVVFAISGLGHVFIATSPFSRLRRLLVERLYKSALSIKHRAIVCQNSDDLYTLTHFCSLSSSEVFLIPGSGVDLSVFKPRPFNQEQPVILMASRLLATKGVREFVEAASYVTQKGFSCRFLLAGEPDYSNPAAISPEELNRWKEHSYVEILGYQSSLNEIMAEAHIVCLPSYYREGLPKVLCEAAACGRAVITTSEPGCRDAIDNGITGLLVPSRDSVALAHAIEYLLLNPRLIRSMGLAGRKRAEFLFNVNNIVQQHLNIYSTLLENLS